MWPMALMPDGTLYRHRRPCWQPLAHVVFRLWCDPRTGKRVLTANGYNPFEPADWSQFEVVPRKGN